jgi:TRAP-type C4-dicarboxylate transport system permease small subunit
MKSEKEVEERLKEIQTLDGLRASVLHIFSNALMFFMFYCIVMMLVSYFWIPRTYNVYELNKGFYIMLYFLLAMTFGILALIFTIISKLKEIKEASKE